MAKNYLSEKSQKLYDFYDGVLVKTAGQKELLMKALQSLDISDEAAKLVKEEGLTITSARSGMSRAHPCLATRKESLAEVVKIFKILGLHRNSGPVDEYGFSEDIV